MTEAPQSKNVRPGIDYRMFALLLVSALGVGLLLISWVSGTGRSPAETGRGDGSTRISPGYPDHAAVLSRPGLPSLDEAGIAAHAQTMVSDAFLSDMVPEESAAQLFPSPGELLAMLARDRDVDDFIENSTEDGAAGEYYRRVAEKVPEMKPLRSRYEALFLGTYKGLLKLGRLRAASQASGSARDYRGGVTLPRLSSRPREREYNLSHTFALDIFYMHVERFPFSTLEKGPLVFSLEEGIIVGSDSTWRGGEDMENYSGGGITPKAGNGVILYSPSTRKYYLYFHLFDALVKTGDIVPKGYPLGYGGNTGTNARKPGHGEHLHLEIYDAARNRFLRNHEIADIVF